MILMCLGYLIEQAMLMSYLHGHGKSKQFEVCQRNRWILSEKIQEFVLKLKLRTIPNISCYIL